MSFRVPSHLYRNRHGTFYFRHCIPKALQSTAGTSELRFSLGTQDRQAAIISALPLITDLPRLADCLQHMADAHECLPSPIANLTMLESRASASCCDFGNGIELEIVHQPLPRNGHPEVAQQAKLAPRSGVKSAAMKAYRAAILNFTPDRVRCQSAHYEDDGLLVVGPDVHGTQLVQAVGPYREVAGRYPDVPVEQLPGRIIAPGFIDLHIHYPQTDVIGSPADSLLPWLENYTFPQEARFSSPEYSAKTARFFIAELLRNGVTTALTFATSHVASVSALFEEAQKNKLRLITGKCLQDRHSPDGVRDQTEQSLIDTDALIQTWHGVDRLGYAITPRFAPGCSAAQLHGAGELAAKYSDVWIQSHVAENREEIAWARELFPTSRSYLATYDNFGLMRDRALYAHCIHFDDDDRALMRDTGAAAAISPTSNLFLGSGFFDYASADRVGFKYGLASDIGGGTSFSPFHTMLAAYYVGREGQTKTGLSLSPQQLWWQHTAGAAQALGLDGHKGRPAVGNLLVGCEADFVVLNPQATPLLARRTQCANSLDELLFAMIVLGDDRLIEKTVISQAL